MSRRRMEFKVNCDCARENGVPLTTPNVVAFYRLIPKIYEQICVRNITPPPNAWNQDTRSIALTCELRSRIRYKKACKIRALKKNEDFKSNIAIRIRRTGTRSFMRKNFSPSNSENHFVIRAIFMPRKKVLLLDLDEKAPDIKTARLRRALLGEPMLPTKRQRMFYDVIDNIKRKHNVASRKDHVISIIRMHYDTFGLLREQALLNGMHWLIQFKCDCEENEYWLQMDERKYDYKWHKIGRPMMDVNRLAGEHKGDLAKIQSDNKMKIGKVTLVTRTKG